MEQRVTGISAYLVDDDRVLAEGLRCVLQNEPDIRVLGHANDGRSALEEVGRLAPEIVITDVGVRNLNGIEATVLICSKFPATKIIILSMHLNAELVYRALRAGARGYLLKSSGTIEVMNALRAVHAGRRYFTQKVAEMVLDLGIAGDRPATGPLDSLSSRERQVLQLSVEGKPAAHIAEILSLSPRTVETYRTRLMQKLGIGDLPALVKFAVLHGITPLE